MPTGWVVKVTSRPLYSRVKTTGTHCIGWLLGPRADLDGYGKSSSPHRDPSPTVQPVAKTEVLGEETEPVVTFHDKFHMIGTGTETDPPG
jgi:hypothetical protein